MQMSKLAHLISYLRSTRFCNVDNGLPIYLPSPGKGQASSQDRASFPRISSYRHQLYDTLSFWVAEAHMLETTAEISMFFSHTSCSSFMTRIQILLFAFLLQVGGGKVFNFGF